jgi:uncharacterized cupin superfamily protein
VVFQELEELMPKPIMNVADVSLDSMPPQFAPTGPAAERFEAKTGVIGARIGARKLGYNITAVPPGKRAWPFHNHPAKEEMFFVLQGGGEVRIGETRYPIRTGDIIACPAGGRETAHQITNTGIEELRYLAVSTEHSLEMAQYPDSGKFGLKAEFGTASDGTPKRVILFGRENQPVGFWEGE